MKTAGIIAEYNPFHNGHAYQLRKIREDTGADFVVVVMSPDFVQRGEPAIFDKYVRTAMALRNGADLVLELPVCYACGSAEYFAEGAVRLLLDLDCVDVLAFGCETPNPAALSFLADFFCREPEDYRRALKEFQVKGMTFPQAREAAFFSLARRQEPSFFGESQEADGSSENFSSEVLSSLLSSPNNILALEYEKALKKRNSSIQPLPILRKDNGYHSLSLEGDFCSASALRMKLKENFQRPSSCVLPTRTFEASHENSEASRRISDISKYLAPFLPDSCLPMIQKELMAGRMVFMEDFSSLLHYRLLSESSFASYLDVGSDLSDRIIKLLPHYQSPAQFTSLLKTRQVTEARIRRALLHILLNITKEDTENFRSQNTAFYGRILGFRREASPLLHEMKKSAAIPLIAKLADAKKILSGPAMQMLTQDIYASHVYQLALCQRLGGPLRSEYTCSPVIL